MRLVKSCAAVCLAIFAIADVAAQEQDLQIALGYHSDYVSQGRSNLDRGGMGEASLFFDSGVFFTGLALLEADRSDYTETNLLLGLALESGNFGMSLALTRIFVDHPINHGNDTELNIELVYEGFGLLVPFGNYIYSLEERATWLDLGVSTPLMLGNAELSPYLASGWNQGYIGGEGGGLNHLQLGVDLSLPLTDALELSAYLSHSRPWEREPADSTEKLVWGGVGVTFSF